MVAKSKAAAVKKLRKADKSIEAEKVGTPDTPEPESELFVPQKAAVPHWEKRPEYKPAAHFRDQEIDRLPRPIAMSGPGVGAGGSKGRGR